MSNFEDKEYRKELAKSANNYIAPFTLRYGENGEVTIRNGTAFFLDTGTKKLLVTAAHVFEEYKKVKEVNNDVVCQLGNVPFDPINKVIDSNDILDTATFDIEGHEHTIAKAGKSFLTHLASAWPPPPPEVGKSIFFAGFPGIERIHSKNNKNKINFGSYNIIEAVDQVTERNILLTYNHKEMIDIFGNGLPPEGYNFAGISGAPLITVVDNKSGLQTWRLGGIIYEASTEFGIIYATRADFILPDGKIKSLIN